MSYYECEHGRDIGRCQECADEKDNRAEITRLTAALARVRGQRDAMAEYLSDDADLVEEFGLRIVNGMVEEIEA